MSINTRLILLLTIAVGTVMAFASFVMLRQREAALLDAMRDEVRAHALTLQIALEQDYAAGRAADAQLLINRLGDNTKIYGVVLFDEAGRVMMLSDDLIPEEIQHPPELERVITTGEVAEFVRRVGDRDLFSIIMPVHVGSETRGAFEIAQPLSFVRTDIARTRRNWALTTALLVVTIFAVVLAVMRRSLSQPIRELLGGAAALGQGDLNYRVIVPAKGSEFARLAREFNRMADRLEEQRRSAERAAEQRLALERELRHSERLAAVGRLAAGVAHEMGAPLNVIDARAEQLLARPDAPFETRQRNLTIIRAQSERITRIVRQLLNLARPYDLRRAPVDLAALLRATVEQLGTDAQRARVEIEVRAAEHLLVYGDQDFLRQVFLNICANAIQAMPGGGRLLVEAGGEEMEKEGQVFLLARVSDTGEGIAPESLDKIFDPFYTTKDVGSGTGLGLSVSQRIVAEHGGWIEAANQPGGGAVFTLYLPRYAGAAEGTRDEAGRHDEDTIVSR